MSLMSMLQSPNELGPRAALLQHYNVVKQHTEQSKSRVSCKGCSHTFAGKTTRMAAHYMQTAGESVSLCKSPPEGATDAATAHFSALEKKRVTTKKRKVDNDAIDSKQLSIWKMLDGKGHDSANAAFARMVFAHGLSFNIGTSKYLLDVMEEARKNPGWCPQGRIALSTTALDREYDKVNKHTKIQINELASIYGKTWQTDGWTDKRGTPHTNHIESADGVERFVVAHDCSGHKKDMAFLADQIKPYMDRDTDVVMADGACAGMLKILERLFPWLTGMKCCAHAVDLLMKDIAKQPWAADIIKRNLEVIKFVKNHHFTSALFRTKTGLSLVTPNATRFATNLISAMRTLKVALPLQNFANDPALQEYLKNASPSIRAAGRKAISELNEKDDVQGKFWFEVRFFVKMMEVCYTLLRMADGTKPCMSKFFNGMLSMPAAWDAVIAAQVVETNAIEDEGFNDPEVRARLGPMKERLQDRRVYMHSPMLGAAFATDPEFRKVDLLSVDGGGVLNDFKTMCTRILIDFKDDEDPEVTIAESESLPDGGPVGRALAQLPRFKNKDWGGAAFLPSAKSMSVASWWQQYGRMDGFDEIAKVAVRCNSKIPASAGSERNWSLFGDVMGGRHARLGADKAKKLVFVRANLKLLANDYTKRPFIAWDPDSVESDGFLGSGEGEDDPDSEESDFE